MNDEPSRSESREHRESPAFGTTPRRHRVREAAPGDAAALARVAAETFPLACPPHVTAEAIADFIAANLSEARFDGYLEDPARQLLLAEAGGQDGVDATAAGYAMVVHAAPSDPDVSVAVSAGTLLDAADRRSFFAQPEPR
jgi:hypothetical protein